MTYGLGTYGTGTYGIGEVTTVPATPTPPGEPLVAGVPFQRLYTVTVNGVRYERLLAHGGAVTRLRYFPGTNTSATPVVDVGPFTSSDGVEWLSPEATIPAAGTYTPVVTIRVTADPASVQDDVEAPVTVYSLDGVIDGEVPTGGSGVTVAQIKARLNARTNVNDAEIAELLRAAEAEYVEFVGPLEPQAFTETHLGGGTIILRHAPVLSVETVTYSGGVMALTDLDIDLPAGLIRWVNPWWGYGPITVTYTAGGVPEHHREVIRADVANLYSLTQRGGGGRGGYSELDDGDPSTPLVLFPRIRALVPQAVVA